MKSQDSSAASLRVLNKTIYQAQEREIFKQVGKIQHRKLYINQNIKWEQK